MSRFIVVQLSVSAIPPSPQTFVPSAAPTYAPDPCQDQNPNCGNFDMPATCTNYAAWSKDNCQRTCQICQRKYLMLNMYLQDILHFISFLKDISVS